MRESKLQARLLGAQTHYNRLKIDLRKVSVYGHFFAQATHWYDGLAAIGAHIKTTYLRKCETLCTTMVSTVLLEAFCKSP